MKLRGVTLLGIILMILALIAQIGLFGYSYTGYEKDSPVLVMYGNSDSKFTATMFRMAMGRAGFQTLILNKDLVKAQSIGEQISLPRGYRSQSIVILAQGEAATSSLKLFDTDEDTLGFVLVNPKFETNYSMEGMGSTFPVHDVAIFTDDNAEKSDSKIMYERLSGEDTLFGITSKTGGTFSSEVYMNPLGNRYLSVSSIGNGDGLFFYMSPSFQIELADYLASNYSTGREPAKAIIGWYMVFIMSIALFISGLFMFLSKIPVVRFRMVAEDNDKIDFVTKVIVLTAAVLTSVGLVVLTVIGGKEDLIFKILGLFPCAMLVLMALIRTPYLFKNFKVKRPHKTMSLAAILTFAILSFALLIVNNAWGMKGVFDSPNKIVIAVSVFILDFISIMIVARCDSISRIKGFGGCSYFGTYMMFLFTMIPSFIMFMVCALLGKNDIALLSIGGVFCAFLPFISAMPVKRHANVVRFTATVHAGIYLILLILMI